MKIEIEKVDNGYIVNERTTLDNTRVFVTLDEVLQRVLTFFENRYPGLGGDAHGEVKVLR